MWRALRTTLLIFFGEDDVFFSGLILTDVGFGDSFRRSTLCGIALSNKSSTAEPTWGTRCVFSGGFAAARQASGAAELFSLADLSVLFARR